MTRFLVSDTNPQGHKLEDILMAIRKDVITRCSRLTDDTRSEALHVLDNNMKVLGLLSEAINLARDSTQVLDKAFGPNLGGPPRVGD